MLNGKKGLGILIAEDHIMFRESIAQFLREVRGIAKVGEASNGVEVLKLVKKEKWDVILLDIHMPEMNGFETLMNLEPISNCPVIVVSFSGDNADVLKAFQMGAMGYVLKDCDTKELILAIKKVANGGTHYTESVQSTLLNSIAGNQKSKISDLSDRELAILKLICQEKSSKEIAKELNISVPTVNSHRNALLQKTGCSNAVGLGLFASKNGLV